MEVFSPTEPLPSRIEQSGETILFHPASSIDDALKFHEEAVERIVQNVLNCSSTCSYSDNGVNLSYDYSESNGNPHKLRFDRGTGLLQVTKNIILYTLDQEERIDSVQEGSVIDLVTTLPSGNQSITLKKVTKIDYI